jgi:hypothetical protein
VVAVHQSTDGAARGLDEGREGEDGPEPGERLPDPPPGGAVREGRRRGGVHQQAGDDEGDPASRDLGRGAHRAAGERHELQCQKREEGEAGQEQRSARQGRLGEVDRPAERPVGRMGLDHHPAPGRVEGGPVRP